MMLESTCIITEFRTAAGKFDLANYLTQRHLALNNLTLPTPQMK